MKKISACTIILTTIFVICFHQSTYCAEVSVDIKGSPEIAGLKDGIQKTITTRCLARGINLGNEPALSVSIIQMGDTISLDAVLDAKPPRAFHKDLKGTGELSAALDQMINEIFTPAPPKAAPTVKQETSAQTPPVKQHTEINLSFVATSMAIVGEVLFVSSEDTIFKMDNTTAKPYWTPVRDSAICRLFTYKEGLIVVTKKANEFFSYYIKDGQVEKTWDRCVVVSGDRLITSRLTSDFDVNDGMPRWQKAEAIEGNADILPGGTDILAMAVSDVSPAMNGEEVVTFDSFRNLTITNGSKTIWKSDTRAGTLPLYITSKRMNSGYQTRSKDHEQEIRYYLMPRILVQGENIITIINDEGLTRVLGNMKFYDGARVIVTAPDQNEFRERDLSLIRNYYCADIILDKNSVLALVVKKSTSYIQRIDLQ